MPKVPCAHCGAAFTQDDYRTRYCDGTCYHARQRQRAADTLVARFWEKVNKTDTCWLWTAAQIRGYGQFHLRRDDGKNVTVYAHRYAWAITNGVIADNLSVLHRCDVPLCVNPNHLFLGTQADNLSDARAKGRLVDGAHLVKVAPTAIPGIVARYRPRHNGRQIAAECGISLVHLMRLVRAYRDQQPLQFPPSPQHQPDGHSQAMAGVFERVRTVDVDIRGEVR